MECNSLQKWPCLSKQKGVKMFIQEQIVMTELRNREPGTELWWFSISSTSSIIYREKKTKIYFKICSEDSHSANWSIFSSPLCSKLKISEKLQIMMKTSRNLERLEEVLHDDWCFLNCISIPDYFYWTSQNTHVTMVPLSVGQPGH